MTLNRNIRKDVIIFGILLILFSSSQLFNASINSRQQWKEDEENNSIKAANPDAPILWSYEMGSSIYSLAISSDGNYIVTGDYNDIIHLFHKASPIPLWGYTLNGDVKSVVISSDGNYVAAGGTDGIVYLFETSSSTPLWTYDIGFIINSIAISSNGNYIVVGSYDSKVYLFERSSPTPLWTYTTGSVVTSVAISSDGNYIVSASDSGTAYDGELYLFHRSSSTPLWGINTGRDLDVGPVAISNDGEYIVMKGDYAGLYGNIIRLYHRSSSIPLWEYNAGYEGIVAMDISSDGRYITIAKNPVYGKYSAVILLHRSSTSTLWNYYTEEKVRSVTITPDGNYIVAGTGDGNVYVFHKSSSTPLWTYNTGYIVTSVAISADGTYITAGTANDGYLYLFANTQPPSSFTLSSDADNPDTDGAFILSWEYSSFADTYSVYVSSSYITEINENVILLEEGITNLYKSIYGKLSGTYYYVIVAYNEYGNTMSNCIQINIQRVQKPYILKWYTPTPTSVTSLSISSDGTYIAVGTESANDIGNILLYNNLKPTPLWSSTGIPSSGVPNKVDISTDGNYVAAGGTDGIVYLFETSSSTPLWTYDIGFIINSIAISSNGNYIVVGSYDSKVYLFEKSSPTPLWTYTTSSVVFSVAISSDGNYIVSTSDSGTAYDGELYLFHRLSSTPLWGINTGRDLSVYSVDISNDGEYILMSGDYTGRGGGVLFLYHRSSSIPLWEYNAGYDGIVAMDISSDGSYIVVGTGKGYVRLFHISSSTPLWNYYTEEIVRSVTITPDGNYVVAGTRVGNVYVFHKSSSTPLWTYNTGYIVTTIAISADGTYIAAGTAIDGYLYLFSTSTYQDPIPDTIITAGPSGSINYNDITFRWMGIDDNTPLWDIQYSYFLEGYDTDWSTWTSSTFKMYHDLPDGSYTFKVRAKDRDGNIDPTPVEKSFQILVVIADFPKFLTLPFVDHDIVVQQGWRYNAPIGPNPQDPFKHEGIDYIKKDTQGNWLSFEIIAAAGGEAIWSEGGGYGRFILIRHYEKDFQERYYYTLYSHLNDVILSQEYYYDYGQRYRWNDDLWNTLNIYPVKRGQLLATSGASGVIGHPDWIHLHFEVDRGGYTANRVDPYDLYTTREFYYPGGENYINSGLNYLWSEDPPVIGVSTQSPSCIIELQYDGNEISEIDVGEFFDIFVGDSTDDVGIEQVRFSSDDVQDGVATGEWTDWYDWDATTGDWNADTKIKRWLFATGGNKEVWAEVRDANRQIARDYKNIHTVEVSLLLTGALELSPIKDFYYIGDTLTATFTIKNERNYPITLDVLTVGGRLNGWIPDEGAPDFTHRFVEIMPHEEYPYEGTITLNHVGNYHFFVAYYIENPSPNEEVLLDENNWNTHINLGEGLTHSDRVKNIIVLDEPITPDELIALRDKIQEKLEEEVLFPPNFLEEKIWESPSAWIASIWASFASWVTQSHLTEMYEQLYQEGVNYECFSYAALDNAKEALDMGYISLAKDYLQDYYQYKKLSYMSFSSASELFDDALNVAEIIVEGIREGSNYALRVGAFGLNVIGSFAAAKAIDYLYISVDHALDYILFGEEEDRMKFFQAIIIDYLFSQLKFDFYDGMTIAERFRGGFNVDIQNLNEIFESTLDLVIFSDILIERFYDEALYILTKEVADEIASAVKEELTTIFSIIFSKILSPANILVINTEGESTGLINNELIHGISRSYYFDDSVIIFYPDDSYLFSLKGTDEGVYGLEISSVEEGDTSSFLATDIPISQNELHQYSINWDILSQGEEGATIEVDFDGDGTIEHSFTSDDELNTAEYVIGTLIWSNEGDALQDGVIFEIEAFDDTLVEWIKISIREPGGENGIIIPGNEYEEISLRYQGDNLWCSIESFDTTKLPDGYYVLFVQARDIFGSTSTTTFSFSIRNWALLELLPATERNRAGRTMPVKFSLRVVEAVDPEMPFVINQELEIIIYEESNPEEILQTSFYGDTSIDYRIDEVGELYITNFKTSEDPAIYVVEIYRGDFLIGSFTFETYSSKKDIKSTQVLRFPYFQIFPEFIHGMNLIFQLVGISYLLIISKKKLIY